MSGIPAPGEVNGEANHEPSAPEHTSETGGDGAQTGTEPTGIGRADQLQTGTGSRDNDGRGGRRGRRRGGRGRGERLMVPEMEFSSYYGRQIVKPAPWDWKIPAYLYAGGLAAGSALVAAGAELTGRTTLRQRSRALSMAAVGVSGATLVADLGRPERFLNMMRTVKLTSPMSVGTWIFSGFSAASGLALAAEVAELVLADRGAGAARPRVKTLASVAALAPTAVAALRPGSGSYTVGRAVGRAAALAPVVGRAVPVVRRAAGLGAAALAPPLASYTAVLLADTATPTWHAMHRELPFVFVGSALAAGGGGAAVLSPAAESGPARRLGLLGAGVEFAAYGLMNSKLGFVGEPLHTGRPGQLMQASKACTIGGMATLALFGRWRPAAVVGGLALNAGSAFLRFGITEAGIASAKDPAYVVVPQRQRLSQRSADRSPGPAAG